MSQNLIHKNIFSISIGAKRTVCGRFKEKIQEKLICTNLPLAIQIN